VCSEDDRARLGDPDAVVIPNGYDLTPDATVRPRTTDEPELTIVGLFIYEPNVDGAHYFVKQVLPLVRRSVPNARLVIAGRHEGALDDLADVEGVTVLGELDDLEPIFASSAAVVVPLRSGSGTRIKVLEAFAHELPVASTTIGCEGLGIHKDQEVLIGDTPETLAAACVQLLRDPDRARAVAQAGHDLWERRFQWSDIRGRIRELVLEVGR
jgi:glycosyltransferase involved in cell wall biosynthesis